MLIRHKLLLLLLGIALLPMVIVSWHGYRATKQLGNELAAQSRDFLTARATAQLQQTIETNAALLRRSKDLLETVLRLQAHEVEKRLGKPPAVPLPVYDAERFTGGQAPPPGLKASKKHWRMTANNERRPVTISEDAQNLVLAPGIARGTVAADIARLSTMVKAYREIYARHRDAILWTYTALESGVHAAYPGHGGYPPEYDPRVRPWYTAARDAGGVAWTPMIVDAVTRQVLMTGSMPVRDPGGRFAGVTAIDIPVLGILRDAQNRSAVSKSAKVFLVDLFGADGADKTAIRIFAQRDTQQRAWDALPKLETLTSSDSKALAALTADMAQGKSGVRRMPYRGMDSLWAHGPFGAEKTFFMIVLPYSDITVPARQTVAFVRKQTEEQLKVAAGVTGGMIALVLLLAFFSSRSVTEPARRLAAAARRLADGDFSVRVDVTTKDELGLLGASFNEAVPQLEDRMKVRQALSLAMEVQQHLLPKEAPKLAGYDIAGKSVYCDETGGDYFDFIDLSAPEAPACPDAPPGRIGIAVGDVSGHGFAAALLMTTVRALLRSRAMLCGTLDELMNDINRNLAHDVHSGRFMTMFYLILSRETPALRWVNAGHEPAFVYNCGKEICEELDGGGIPLGIEQSWEYEDRSIEALAPGSILVIATDGVWETRDPTGKMFGKDAFKDLIERNAAEPAAGICDTVHKTLARFRGGGPQTDDITLVVVKKLPDA
ncbi:MAG: SpoIIE family protein phosphatase [Rhodospirillales bacterium]